MKNTKNNSKTNNNNNQNTKTKTELLESLAALNQSISLTYIVIISILLNLAQTYNERAKVIDQLKGINTADYTSLYDKYLLLSRELALFVAIIAFKTSIDDLNSLLSSDTIDEKAIENANRSVLISLLALIAAKLSLDSIAFQATLV